jgi:galactokinase
VSTGTGDLDSTDVFDGRAPDFERIYCAPGRVNIIGEHTDYNEGLVLPTTTAAFTWLAASVRSDRTITIESRNFDETRSFDLDNMAPKGQPGWIDYAAGVAAELEALGIRLQGANLLVNGEIPLGGGLSSSASFEVGVATALLDIANEMLPARQIAELCRRAENDYVGVGCGIMDQLVVSACERGKAMLIDCRTLDVSFGTIPVDVRLLITDSGVKHCLPESGYNNRTQECLDAVQLLADDMPGVTALRDLGADDLEERSEILGDTLYRRCRHVVTENDRVAEFLRALEATDLDRMGSLISESHVSLRDDFEVSCSEVDALVEIADACDGALGSRIVGAGFGGCILTLTTAAKVEQVAAEIVKNYGQVLGHQPWSHIVQPADPAGIVNLK